jgi:hypothetical protein
MVEPAPKEGRVFSFFEQVAHGLWLSPDDMRVKYDLLAIGRRQSLLTEAMVTDWHKVAPGADAAVIEFDFHVVGGAKRKLLRRLDGYISKYRGGFSSRKAMSLKWLGDYALAYDIAAKECGGELVGWRFVPSPLPA